ncbi:NB-ARC - like 10, partial [Theobroma cacao]
MLKKVRRHRKKGQFERVAETLPPAPGDLKPCEHTVGMESMIATVWNCLSEEQAVIIGLYGMGGIGKTTLLTQINNMLLSLPSNVDFVIWAVASKDLKLEKIQDEIGEKIGYSDNRWRNKRIEQKAIDIYRVLSNRKFVLLLDDLWDRVDLTKIGVPIPDQQNNSKVVFTTRSKEVCGLMEAHKRFRVECLPPPFAWHLFQRKVGNDTLNLHPDIPKLAETVAKECAGLPLALITVGRAMACKKTPKEWIRAIEVLRMFGCGSSDLVVHGNLLSGGNECLVQELQYLKKLSMLSLTVKSASALEGFLSSHKFKSCARDLCLEFLSGSNVLNISCLADMKQLNMLEISDCNSLEELKHDWLQEPRKILTSIDFHSSMILKDRCFNNLQRVSVDNCIRLEDLTWLMLAPNLASLCVSRCSHIKEIISTAKCGRLAEVLLGSIKPFEKLEVLHLSYLPELKCIYQDPLPFLSLKKISIFGCPKLTKLPSDLYNKLNDPRLLLIFYYTKE